MSRISPKPDAHYPWYLRLMYKRQDRVYGQRLIPTQIWGRVPILLRRFLMCFRAFERPSSPLPPALRALITVRVSQINHCAFCVDFNSMRVLKQGAEGKKIEDLDRFEESDAFTEPEKAALAYAEAMTFSHREVDDALFDRLRRHYDDDPLVELTGLIALQNASSKFNAALDLPAQGLCRISPRPAAEEV